MYLTCIVLLLNLALVSVAVSSQSILELDFECHAAVESTGRPSRRAGIPTATLQNENVRYVVNLTLGTPPQRLRFQVATNRGDLVIVSEQEPNCAKDRSKCPDGLFRQDASSSYKVVESNFTGNYIDGTNTTGVFATDVMQFGDVQLDNIQFALQFAGTYRANLLGIGYTKLQQSKIKYPNLPNRMFSQGLTKIVGYSMYFNDYNTLNGRIAFGGVDTGKFYGQLETMEIQATSLQDYSFVDVPLDSLAIQSNNGRKRIPGSSLKVQPDSASGLITLPASLVQQIQEFTQFANEPRDNFLVKENGRVDESTLLNMTFGATTISIPMSSLSWQYNSTHRSLFIKTSTTGRYVLGLPFFRAAYTVFDLTHNQFSVAPLNLNSRTTNITAIPAAGVVGMQGVSLDSQRPDSEPGTNGTTGGGKGNGVDQDTSSGLSTGAKIGAGVGGAVGVALVVALIAAIFLVRRRRHRKRKQATATATAAAAASNNEKASDPLHPSTGAGYGVAGPRYYEQEHSEAYGERAELAPMLHSHRGYSPDLTRASGISSELSESTIAASSSGSAAQLVPSTGVQRVDRKPVAAPVEMPATMSVSEREPLTSQQEQDGSHTSGDIVRSPVSPPLDSSRVFSGNRGIQ